MPFNIANRRKHNEILQAAEKTNALIRRFPNGPYSLDYGESVNKVQDIIGQTCSPSPGCTTGLLDIVTEPRRESQRSHVYHVYNAVYLEGTWARHHRGSECKLKEVRRVSLVQDED